jgi:NAD(P)-dependent dehydrogenase (short-subunit alcohol dehydrogenase family)
MRLKDKVAIIRRAGTGIGEVIAHKFARERARVLLAGLPSEPVQDAADAIVATGGRGRWGNVRSFAERRRGGYFPCSEAK